MSITKTKSRDSQHYELVEYMQNIPFQIYRITRKGIRDDYGNIKDILEHWHPEIEVVYTLAGHAVHYIDGCAYTASPGSVFVVNSESIHKVMTDFHIPETQETIAVVLHLNYDFVKEAVSDFMWKYFVADADFCADAIGAVMKKLEEYADNRKTLEPYEHLKMMGMVYELLFWICRDGLAQKEEVLPISNEKNLERLRGVMLYVEEHYKESITQKQVAERFYFTKEYFARFFKKNTGMTFKEYLKRFRANKARDELLYTGKNILEIALDNGFSDSRGFINAFKSIYQTTPLQYRKKS